MKKLIVGSTVIILMLGTVGASFAQDQQPGPYDQAGPYDQGGPQDQQSGPYDQPGPYDQAGPPDQAGPSDQAPPSDQGNQAQPGMARISFIQGSVSTQRGDTGDWIAVTVNTPVAVGDRVSTGQGGRAELQLDFADILRMSSSATAKIASLDRGNIQVQVGQGIATYSVLKGAQAASEIDTPNATVHPLGEGNYRIVVNSDQETQVIVREGSAEISTPQGSTRVDKGQMITIQGASNDNPQYKIDPAPGADEWDTWNNERNRTITGAASWQHTDPYYTGSQDLDQYGEWSEVPDYGQVWTPSQGPGWAPYSSGQWVWEPYYGWTWVSYEPWGWAPYHYGRWFVYGGRWAWWPGPIVAYPHYYPVWAPAYVSFFGWGGGGWGFGFGVGFGFGSVGWLPCGPGDWYHPWWGRWGGRYNAYDHFGDRESHNGFAPLRGEHGFSNIHEAFTNDRVRAGMRSMNASQFGHSSVPSHQEGISAASFRQASMMTGKIPATPGRGSYSAAGREADPSSFRHAPSGSQHFFTSSRTGTTFGNHSEREQSSFGAGRNGGSWNRSSSEGTISNRGGSASGQSSRSGWRTFTPPESSNHGGTNNSGRETFGSGSRNSAPTSGNRSGWEQYNSPERGGQQNNPSPEGSSHGWFGGSSNSNSRPTLNMRQPIVAPRGGSSNNGHGSPQGSYNGPRGGGYSAPHGPSGGEGGGNHGGGGGGGNHGGGGGGGGGGGHRR
jgi:FecR protein